MNAAGFMNSTDNSLKDCAIREFLEETNIQSEVSNWKPVANWKYNTIFAGLQFVGFTLAGMCWVDEVNFKKQAKIDKQDSVSIISIENEETESIVLIDVNALRDLSKISLPTKLGGHHYNLLLTAAMNEKLLEKSCETLLEQIPYLREFHYL